MFTAVFCARVIFDIIDRKRWATKFNMRQMLAATNYDFMRIWKGFTAVSVVIIVIGLIATFARGKGLFDIDFNGGTSVQPLLKQPVSTDEVRGMLNAEFGRDKTQFSLTNIQVASGDKASEYRDRVFKIDTAVPTVKDLQERLKEALKDQQTGESLLATYNVTYDAPRPVQVTGPSKSVDPLEDTKGDDAKQPDSASPAPTETKTNNAAPSDQPEEPKPQDKPAAPAETPDEKPAEKPAEKSNEKSEGTTEEKPAEKPAAKPADGEAKPESPCGIGLQDEPSTDQPAKPDQPADEPAKKSAEGPDAKPSPDAPVDAPSASVPVESEQPASTEAALASRRVQILMESTLRFETRINSKTLEDRINDAADNEGISRPVTKLLNPDWDGKSSFAFDEWTVQLTGSEDEAKRILSRLQTDLAKTPVFLSSSEVGGQVAADTQQRAIVALLASMVGIVLYIWLRFQHVVWGLAAVLALVHDVLIMLAAISASYWLEPMLRFMMVEEFKINLTMIAAFLTLVGYSINDTIVLFDRLREIRGKSPNLTREMINQSINQTLSRTILTALTVFMVVVILYFFGGETIHGFAFAMVVGTFAGSYSSIYIAAPVLLVMSVPEHSKKPEPVAVEK